VTDRGGAVTDFDFADRVVARLDAIQPVLVMVFTGVKPDAFIVQRFSEDFCGRGFEGSARHKNRTFLAFESDSIPVFAPAAAALDDNSTRVFESDVEFLRGFVKFLRVVLSSGFDFDRSGVIGPSATSSALLGRLRRTSRAIFAPSRPSRRGSTSNESSVGECSGEAIGIHMGFICCVCLRIEFNPFNQRVNSFNKMIFRLYLLRFPDCTKCATDAIRRQ